MIEMVNEEKQKGKIIMYKNKSSSPRAWFYVSIETIKQDLQYFNFLNSKFYSFSILFAQFSSRSKIYSF